MAVKDRTMPQMFVTFAKFPCFCEILFLAFEYQATDPCGTPHVITAGAENKELVQIC